MIWGKARELDGERRPSGGWLETYGRNALGWLLEPVVGTLVRLGITPNMVTIASLLPALAAGWLAACGQLAAAGALYLLAGACDFVDGRLARRSGRATPGGALLDSVLDRYGECAFLTGLAWYYQATWVSAAVVLLITGSLLVPYIRARAEGLGLRVTTGFLQRPERVVLLGAAAILTPLTTPVLFGSAPLAESSLLAWTVAALAVLSHATAVHRLHHAVRMLDRSPTDKPVDVKIHDAVAGP